MVVDKVNVCQTFLLRTLEVSRALISNVLGRLCANASRLAGRNGGSDSSESKTCGIVAFLPILADETCDEMPNKNEQHLPHGNKLIVFRLYEDNKRRYGRNPSQKSFFYRVWKEMMRHVKFQRSHSFSVSGDCLVLKAKFQSISRVPGKERQRENLRLPNI